ncbi:MAG TPA: MerR family transcriptional regulator [Gemmatimonadales bacterium]|nr:MerR family transcriptional regulator [Gemmatimonadales bacterium]
MADALLALREYAKLAPWNIRDLSSLAAGILDASRVTPINAAAQSRPNDRTVRFYVTRRLISSPDGRGTAATYGYRHLLQLLAIKLRQMEGVTLQAIEKELADSPGDVLEKRVAAALGPIPGPDQLDLGTRGGHRGRVARALGARTSGPVQPEPRRTEAAIPNGAWFRLSLGDGVELQVRSDHPAARSQSLRQRVTEAVARALADAADDQAI